MGASVRPDIVQQELARIRGEQPVDVEAELAKIRKGKAPPTPRERQARAMARTAATEAERAQNEAEANQGLATSLTTLIDNMAFGAPGLVADIGTTMRSGAPSMQMFRTIRDARQAEREKLPTSERVGLGVAGALANPVSVFGAAPKGAGLFGIGMRGAGEGMVQGGLQAAGENVGTTTGAGGPALLGMAAGAAAGGILSPIAARIAGGRVTQGMGKAEIDAGQRLFRQAELDAEQGFAPRSLVRAPGMPPALAVDVAGPNVRSTGRTAAQSVPGREALRAPFEAREAAAVREITQDAPNIIKTQRQLSEARRAQAEVDFDAAAEATKGTPIDDQFVDALLETPTGKAAWREVQQNRPDLVLGTGDPDRALPVVTRQTPQGPEDVVRPDAEAIHEIIRHLNRWASGEVGQTFPEGVSAISAGNALGLLKRVKDILPDPYRLAVENYARASEPLEAIRLGRRPWSNNPANPKAKPTDAVMARAAAMTPESQRLMQEAKQFDLASRLNRGTLKPGTMAEMLRRPNSELAREVQFAGGPLAQRALAWNDVLHTQGRLLSDGIPATPEMEPGLLAEASRDLTFSPMYATLKALRGRIAPGIERRAVQADAAFNRILGESPEKMEKVLDVMRKRDREAREAAGRVAARSGRVAGGLLDR
jgi:hypothetical protein